MAEFGVFRSQDHPIDLTERLALSYPRKIGLTTGHSGGDSPADQQTLPCSRK